MGYSKSGEGMVIAEQRVKFQVRYKRSFLEDLKRLKSARKREIGKFVFVEFMQLNRLEELPELRQMGSQTIFYRFTLNNYIIAIEVTGQIVKFLRILPKPRI